MWRDYISLFEVDDFLRLHFADVVVVVVVDVVVVVVVVVAVKYDRLVIKIE